MAKGPISDDRLAEYRENGFLLVRNQFDQEETALLRRAAKEDRDLTSTLLAGETGKAERSGSHSGTIRGTPSTG